MSGDMTGLTTGESPDPYGIDALQSPALTPMLFRFTFDQPRGFVITSNETLTPLEMNTFSLPLGGSGWNLLSATNCTVNNSGGEVSFVGTIASPPYGQFALSAAGGAFDFLVTNTPGYPYYGSALSIDVVDQATPTKGTSWGHLKSRYR
jgi:hypothetical protein